VFTGDGITGWIFAKEATHRFCLSYPQALVKYHERKAQYCGHQFLFHAVSFRHGSRRDPSLVELITDDLELQRKLLKYD
jgi:hypothetical protein